MTDYLSLMCWGFWYMGWVEGDAACFGPYQAVYASLKVFIYFMWNVPEY